MAIRITKLKGKGFLSFPKQPQLLLSEFEKRFNIHNLSPFSENLNSTFSKTESSWYGELLFCPDFCEKNKYFENQKPYWASVVLEEPFLLEFDSIGEAASSLKEIQRNWAPYQYQFFRRAELIQQKLPYINLKERNFFKFDEESNENKFALEIPKSPMGIFTLINEKTILASAKTSSSIPCGRIKFVEDHENPPSRAYLKIQESLTLARHFFDCALPSKNSLCFEAGACPGGWTWVLKELGSKVFAVDRAELAPDLMKNPNIKFLAHDAFTLKPEDVLKEMNTEKLDWVFSDVICYPERLFEWVNVWLASGCTKNMICTIKMQGEIDWPLIQKFADIPGSRIVHLNYNKHELTWINCRKE